MLLIFNASCCQQLKKNVVVIYWILLTLLLLLSLYIVFFFLWTKDRRKGKKKKTIWSEMITLNPLSPSSIKSFCIFITGLYLQECTSLFFFSCVCVCFFFNCSYFSCCCYPFAIQLVVGKSQKNCQVFFKLRNVFLAFMV